MFVLQKELKYRFYPSHIISGCILFGLASFAVICCVQILSATVPMRLLSPKCSIGANTPTNEAQYLAQCILLLYEVPLAIFNECTIFYQPLKTLRILCRCHCLGTRAMEVTFNVLYVNSSPSAMFLPLRCHLLIFLQICLFEPVKAGLYCVIMELC